MTATRTRQDIETEAASLLVNPIRPSVGYRHTCNDRDWCTTTGPTGCGSTEWLAS